MVCLYDAVSADDEAGMLSTCFCFCSAVPFGCAGLLAAGAVTEVLLDVHVQAQLHSRNSVPLTVIELRTRVELLFGFLNI